MRGARAVIMRGAHGAQVVPGLPRRGRGRGVFAVGRGRSFAGLVAALVPTLLSAVHLSGQAPQFRHLSTDEGLASPWVTAILQDHVGYMWFGTANGLNRYDGDTLVAHRHRRDDPATLPDNRVNALLEDGAGTLWVGTSALSRYDRERDAFVHYMVAGPRQAGRLIGSLLEDSGGRFWVGTNFGIYRFDRRSGREYPLDIPWPGGPAGGLSRVLLEDRRHHLWFTVTERGLADYDPATGRFRFYQRDGQRGGLPDNNVSAMVEDPAGGLWLATSTNGLAGLDPATGAFRSYDKPAAARWGAADNLVQGLLSDGAGGLWLGTGNGLDHFDPARGFVHYPADASTPSALSGESVWSLYRDAGGTLWIGTYSGGLNLLTPQGNAIQLYESLPGNSSGLPNPNVQGFAEDSAGVVWIANGFGGIVRFEPRTGHMRRYNQQPGLNVLSVAVDARGVVWAGCWHGGLARLDPRTGTLTTLTTANSGIPTDDIVAVHVDSQGIVWLGTHGGLAAFDPARQAFTRYPLAPANRDQGEISQILELADGRLALATLEHGLVLFDRRTGALRSYWAQRGQANALASDQVRSLLEAGPGVLWIGTSAGLDRLELRTGQVTHITGTQGLPGSVVSGMARDAAGNLWISTGTAGIVRFRIGTGPTRFFSREDGLQGAGFNRGAALSLRDGGLLFGGGIGFNVIRPDRLLPNTRRPPVVLTRLELFNRPVAIGARGSPLTRPLGETPRLTLSHDQSMFTLHFTALDYSAPGRNQFAYKLEGFDKDWVRVGSAHAASYAGLPPGRYVFHVIASNNDGLWNEQGVSLPITIQPPLTGTWWFHLLAAALVSGGAAIVIVNARRRHLLLSSMNARLAAAAERDRSAEEDLERNVLDLLTDLRRSARGGDSLPVPVESDQAIAALRRGIGDVLAERRRAEEDLRQSQKLEAVGRLAGGVAHDFNNLLTVINGNLTLALVEVEGDPASRQELEEVQRAARSAGSLTGQLLAVSRKQVLQPRLLNLNALVQEVARLIGRGFDERVLLELRLDSALGRVRADQGQIEQILMNLLVNARDAMAEGGTILVETRNVAGSEVRAASARRNQPYVALSVQDTGSGMTPDVRERIFEPFFTTKEAGQGTGLGLSTVYAAVEQSGGYLYVDSTPGRGTTLTVYLPRTDEEPAAGREERPQAAAAPGPGTTVLLAEDEDALRRLTMRILRRAGYTVLEAASGPAALDAAAQYPGHIDLLLTDVVMPGMSGRELAELLLPSRPGMRLLYTSGYTEDAIIRHGVSGKSAPFLQKPFTPEQLLHKLRAVLEEAPVAPLTSRHGSRGRGA